MIRVMLLSVLLAGCAAAPSKEPNKVLSVIGLGACGHWMGGIVVTADGQVHPSTDLTEDQAAQMVKPLPKGTSTVAMAPCIKEEGIGT